MKIGKLIQFLSHFNVNDELYIMDGDANRLYIEDMWQSEVESRCVEVSVTHDKDEEMENIHNA